MPTLRSFIITSLTALLLTGMNNSTAATDQDEILALYQGWIRALESSDIDGYVGGLHPDVSLRPPGVTGLDGRDNYKTFLGPVLRTACYKLTVSTTKCTTMLGEAAVVEYN